MGSDDERAADPVPHASSPPHTQAGASWPVRPSLAPSCFGYPPPSTGSACCGLQPSPYQSVDDRCASARRVSSTGALVVSTISSRPMPSAGCLRRGARSKWGGAHRQIHQTAGPSVRSGRQVDRLRAAGRTADRVRVERAERLDLEGGRGADRTCSLHHVRLAPRRNRSKRA